MTTNHLPVFVYGTLRPSFGNYEWCLKDRTTSEQPATLDAAVMLSNGGFPYVKRTDDPTQVVVGTLMHLDPAQRTQTMRDLDMLEGFIKPGARMNHYDREVVQVRLTDGSLADAWTYLASPVTAARTAHLTVVESGDWALHRGRPAVA